MKLKVTPLAYTENGKWVAKWFVTKVTPIGVIPVSTFDDLFECLEYFSHSIWQVEIDERIIHG